MAYKKPPKEHEFKPGESGNPGGAPRGKRISTSFAHLMDMTPAEVSKFRKRKDLVGADIIALKWYDKAKRINDQSGPKLLDMALDRTEGKVTQVHKIEGTDRGNLTPEELDALWRRRQNKTT